MAPLRYLSIALSQNDPFSTLTLLVLFTCEYLKDEHWHLQMFTSQYLCAQWLRLYLLKQIWQLMPPLLSIIVDLLHDEEFVQRSTLISQRTSMVLMLKLPTLFNPESPRFYLLWQTLKQFLLTITTHQALSGFPWGGMRTQQIFSPQSAGYHPSPAQPRLVTDQHFNEDI